MARDGPRVAARDRAGQRFGQRQVRDRIGACRGQRRERARASSGERPARGERARRGLLQRDDEVAREHRRGVIARAIDAAQRQTRGAEPLAPAFELGVELGVGFDADRDSATAARCR